MKHEEFLGVWVASMIIITELDLYGRGNYGLKLQLVHHFFTDGGSNIAQIKQNPEGHALD